MEKARDLLPTKGVTYVDDMDSVAEGCDALVVATEWPEFKKLNLAKARDAMTVPLMFDGRNLFNPAQMKQIGFTYKSIGR
jgi:UDPglucose 6-dehydrogenase